MLKHTKITWDRLYFISVYQRKNPLRMFREYEKILEIMSQGQVILKLCKSSPNIPRGLVLGKPTESVGGASIRYLEVYSTIDIRF